MNNDYRKTIEIEHGKGKIIYIRDRDYTLFRGIIYGVLDDEGDIVKMVSFNMWDDFSFSADSFDDKEYEQDNLIFEIAKENPLYNPLKDFLGSEKEFLLDDDDTREINQKTMKIESDKDKIIITFNNIKENKKISEEKFNVFIKNIMYDGRSKLDQAIYEEKNDVKKRLIKLIFNMEYAIAGKEILEESIMHSKLYQIDENAIFKIIPELNKTKGFEHKHPHHCYDVWEHTIEALKRSKPDLQIRMALLLHDIGKPHCYQEDGDIRHFKGHPEKSEEMAEKILQRLGYEEKEVEDICYLVKNHDTLIDVNKINDNNIELTKKLLYIQYCDAYAHAPQHVNKRIQKLDEIYKKIGKLLERQQEELEIEK